MTTKKTGTRRGAPKRRLGESTTEGHRRTRQNRASELAEDYVELIDDLISEHGEARAVDIARYLGVSHVTVTKTIDRLQTAGLVKSAPYRSIFLTREGKRIAAQVRKRHELVYEFLIALGVPQRDAIADAEGIEHHISPKTLEAMKRFIDERPS